MKLLTYGTNTCFCVFIVNFMRVLTFCCEFMLLVYYTWVKYPIWGGVVIILVTTIIYIYIDTVCKAAYANKSENRRK